MNKTHIKYFLAAGLIIFLFYEIYSHQILLTTLLEKLQTLSGPKLIICFCLVFIFSSLFIIPLGLPLNLLAGLIWGTVIGGLLINILATLAAAISFLLARAFGERFLDHLIRKHSFFNQLKNTINKYDWQFISMARINPVVPFSLSNYLFGLIPELSFRHYILATIVANLLPCFVFASIGSILKSFSLANNTQIHHLILQIGIALLLISALITYKMVISNQQKNFSLNKEIA